jgi:putative cardiolipin synthase
MIRNGALLILVLPLYLIACTQIPQRAEVLVTHSRTDDSSPLSQLKRKLAPNDVQSGFRFLSVSPFALATRNTLTLMAHDTIDAQYYEVGDDATGKTFLRELRDAALRGVRVRLLVDDWGTIGLDKLLSGLETYPNVEVRVFNPFFHGRSGPVTRILSASFDIRRVNRRMHNKLLVVDGVATIFGGRNIADEYFMRSSDSDFVDVELFGLGPVAQQLDEEFDGFWNSAFSYPLEQVTGPAGEDAHQSFEQSTAGFDHVDTDLIPEVDLLGYSPLRLDANAALPDLHWAFATAYFDSPEKIILEGNVQGLDTATSDVMSIAHSAKVSLTLVSPYFVPNDMAMAKIAADRARGVKVTVLTNSLLSTDEPTAYAGYAKRRRQLLELGVEIYEVESERFRQHWPMGRSKGASGALHEKAVVIDSSTIALGSLNLDGRSATLNTEDMALILSPPLAIEMDRLIERVETLGAYQVKLNPATAKEEWVAATDHGEIVLLSEPGGSPLKSFEAWLIREIVPIDSM